MRTPVKIMLDRKREGGELDSCDIRALIAAYTKGEVPDYQMAAFTMAVCCRGMSRAETLALTEAMRDSGEKLDWSFMAQPSVDKHSTGGVGDKLSLVIQPLAASCGVIVPSLAGRGLGLTGGTIDKLESIPGYNASLPIADFRKTVARCGCSIAAQTAEIAPADKRLYALRDVTGTVASIPLIVASILSKKLAEGAQSLVFDVKCGKGAFMKTREQASALARQLVDGAQGANRKAFALVTDMDIPLGRAVGNSLEVLEALDVLKGKATDVPDVVGLSVELAARMVSLAIDIPPAEAREMCRRNLENGKAYAVFAEMVKLHGGDLEAFLLMNEDPDRVSCATLHSPMSGFVSDMDAGIIAQTAFSLGAGRAKADDVIDPFAGVVLSVAYGDKVEKGQPLAKLYAKNRSASLNEALKSIAPAFVLSAEPPSPRSIVMEEVCMRN